MLVERVLQVWRWYLQRFRRYRKKTRGGARNSPPPVGRGLTPRKRCGGDFQPFELFDKCNHFQFTGYSAMELTGSMFSVAFPVRPALTNSCHLQVRWTYSPPAQSKATPLNDHFAQSGAAPSNDHFAQSGAAPSNDHFVRSTVHFAESPQTPLDPCCKPRSQLPRVDRNCIK